MIEIEPTHKSPQNCQSRNLYLIINIILHINTISNVLWPRTMLYRLSRFCISITLAPYNAFHSTMIACWIWWVHESPGRQSTARWCFCGDQNRFQPFGFDLRFGIIHSTSHVIHREQNTLSGLVGTRKCLRKLKCTIVAILRRSYSICLDVKCSNSSKNAPMASASLGRAY